MSCVSLETAVEEDLEEEDEDECEDLGRLVDDSAEERPFCLEDDDELLDLAFSEFLGTVLLVKLAS